VQLDGGAARELKGAMEIFGTLADGRNVERHRLESAGGLCVDILNFGGVLQRVFAPDREGRLADVALGYADLDSYLANPFFFGALIGRCANRIANGRMVIDGVTYILSRITVPGATYLALIAVIPELALSIIGSAQQFPFGGTSVLIIVGVGLDTVKQIESQLMLRNYEGFLR